MLTCHAERSAELTSVVKTYLDFEGLVTNVIEKAEKEAIEHLESIRSRASREGVKCNIIVTRGEEPFQEIVDEAAKNHVNMIVMGTHGRMGFKRLLMGSAAERVIGYSESAVLIAIKPRK
ncbi:MAG: universal stress protein [Nitrospirota bacterium]